MTLEEKVNQNLKQAMKDKDQAGLRGIRAIKNAILLAKTDGSGNKLDDSSEIKLLQKLIKQRRESLDIFKTQNRNDLAIIEEEEIAVIEKFLPAQLTEEEVKPIIQGIITDTGADSMKDMGKIMGIASQKLAGKADGKTISRIVKNLLS